MYKYDTVHLYEVKIQPVSASISSHLHHAGKCKKLTQAEHCSQCLIGPTLAFKRNTTNAFKVQNGYAEVFYNLKSMILSLYRNMHVIGTCMLKYV